MNSAMIPAAPTAYRASLFLLGCAGLALALMVAGCSGAAPAPAVEPELSIAAARVTEGDTGTSDGGCSA